MALPGVQDWVFSLKTFASAMLALYIAFSLGLDRPYWAMVTVYMVSQPLTGAMRSKAVYRFFGTLIGAIAAVALVPNLVDTPALLVPAMSLWIGVCLFFSLLDRTPRSYLFMLAGYTAAIIGFPSVNAPLDIFQTAFVRVEETTLAIMCSTIVGTIILPRPVGPVVVARLDAWFAVARDWTRAVLAGRSDEVAARAARRGMAGASVEVNMLVTHLAYDTSLLQAATRPVSILQRRMMLLLPLISGVGDRLALLRKANALTSEVQAVLNHFVAWLYSGDVSEKATARMQDMIARATPQVTTNAGWSTIVSASLMNQMAELAEIAHDVQALRRQIMTGSPALPALALPRGIAPDATRYRDYGMALLSASAAGLGVGLVCVFWIVTAWADGASAAMMAAVLCSFFAAQDNPVPAILSFLYCTAIATVIGGAYLFAILPVVTGFEMLCLALAPTFLVLGVLAAMPATFLVGLAIAVNAAAMLALSDTYHANFADYVNTSLAVLAGIAAAATVTAIIRSVGAAWSAQRLQRAGWRDISRAASRWGGIERPALAALMLDQLADLTTRLAASDLNADYVFRGAIRDLRVGLNVVDIEHESPDLPEPTRATLRAMLDGIEEYYTSRAPRPPDASLRERVDRAIAAVTATQAQQLAPLLMQLADIRHGLFPEAASFRSTVPETDVVLTQ